MNSLKSWHNIMYTVRNKDDLDSSIKAKFDFLYRYLNHSQTG